MPVDDVIYEEEIKKIETIVCASVELASKTVVMQYKVSQFDVYTSVALENVRHNRETIERLPSRMRKLYR